MANKTILLVEDNPDDETLTCMALRENRLLNEIVVAHNGVDGLDVLRAIRGDDRTKSPPGVILPSSNEERDRVAGYRLGANSDVRKPVDFHPFTDAVKQLGLYRRLLNEPPPRSDR